MANLCVGNIDSKYVINFSLNFKKKIRKKGGLCTLILPAGYENVLNANLTQNGKGRGKVRGTPSSGFSQNFSQVK